MAEESTINVAIRVRPLNTRENSSDIITEVKNTTILLKDPINLTKKTFTFDNVFDCNTSQSDVFNIIGTKVIDSAVKGYNTCVFAYGQSGCFAKGTKIMLHNGKYKKVEKITHKDVIMGDDSTPRNIIKLFTGMQQMYKVSSNYGSYVVNRDHIMVFQHNDRVIDMPLKDYLSLDEKSKKDYYCLTTSVDFPEQKLEVPAFYFASQLKPNQDIPNEYIYNSKDNREDFLTNLLRYSFRYDTINEYYYSDTLSANQIKKVSYLAKSLGYNAFYGTVFIVNKKHKNTYLPIITPLDTDRYYGFMLDGNHRFIGAGFNILRNSGKTHSMIGSDKDNEGLIPRICKSLFEKKTDNATCKVEVSYLEIYSEEVKDLLSKQNPPGGLSVRFHPEIGPYVDGLTRVLVEDYTGIKKLIDQGNKERAVASTILNARSSRSHAILTLYYTQIIADDKPRELLSKINLVDLSGSEKVDVSGVTGINFKEAVSINQSLSNLGLVINKLAQQSMLKVGDPMPVLQRKPSNGSSTPSTPLGASSSKPGLGRPSSFDFKSNPTTPDSKRVISSNGGSSNPTTPLSARGPTTPVRRAILDPSTPKVTTPIKKILDPLSTESPRVGSSVYNSSTGIPSTPSGSRKPLSITPSTPTSKPTTPSSARGTRLIEPDTPSGSRKHARVNSLTLRKPLNDYIPFRDSKLTWILKESLGGNSKTFMIATLSPSAINYNETLNTLRYAYNAKKIVNIVKVNEDPNDKLVRVLKGEIEQLRSKITEGTADDIKQMKEELSLREKIMREKDKTWEQKLQEAKRLNSELQDQLKKEMDVKQVEFSRKIDSLREEKESLIREMESLKNGINDKEIEKEIAKKQAEFERTRILDTATNLQEYYDKKLATLKTSYEEQLTNEKKSLLESFSKESEDLKAQITKLKEEVDESYKNNINQNKRFLEERTVLSRQIQQLHAKIHTLEKSISIRNASKEVIEEEIKELCSEMDKKLEEYMKLKDLYNTKETQYSDCQTQLNTLTIQLEESKKKLTNLEESYQVLKSQYAIMQKENAELSTMMDEDRIEYQSLVEKKNNLKSLLCLLKGEIQKNIELFTSNTSFCESIDSIIQELTKSYY
jgi:hypothetical protein